MGRNERIDVEVIYSDYSRNEHFMGLGNMVNWAKNAKHSPLVKWAIVISCDDDAAFDALTALIGTKGFESLSVVRADNKNKAGSYRTRGNHARPFRSR